MTEEKITREGIIALLKDYNSEDVEKFASYIVALKLKKRKDNSIENHWIQKKTNEAMAILFKRVAKDGLVFDGVHISLQSTGISYDYVAYKNKMLLAYPESKVDVALVYEGDEFKVAKESGTVMYSHSIKDPLSQDDSKIQGGYCVIQNKRGEFITLLSKEEIDKHRKVARQDYIWKQWFKEMALKTIIKKACKQHFLDIYESIDEKDNENYNLDNPLEIEISTKQEIDEIKTTQELTEYYKKNKGKGKEFDQYITMKKEELSNENL